MKEFKISAYYVGEFVEIAAKKAASDVKPLYYTREAHKRIMRTATSREKFSLKNPDHILTNSKYLTIEEMEAILRTKDGISEKNFEVLQKQMDDSVYRNETAVMAGKMLTEYESHKGDKLVVGYKGSLKMNKQEGRIYFYSSDEKDEVLSNMETNLIVKMKYRTFTGTLEEFLNKIKNGELTHKFLDDIKSHYNSMKTDAQKQEEQDAQEKQ